MTPHSLSRRVCRLSHAAAVIAGMVGVSAQAVSAEDAGASRIRRVRANTPSLAAVIHEATERSTTFRRLMETIDATDGLVYVEEGKCGHSVRACLMLSVTVAGPYRLLRILVDTRKAAGEELMGSIGHELRHAIEVLSDPAVTNTRAMYLFYHREAPSDTGRFETEAALRVGLDVLNEVHAHAKSQ